MHHCRTTAASSVHHWRIASASQVQAQAQAQAQVRAQAQAQARARAQAHGQAQARAQAQAEAQAQAHAQAMQAGRPGVWVQWNMAAWGHGVMWAGVSGGICRSVSSLRAWTGRQGSADPWRTKCVLNAYFRSHLNAGLSNLSRGRRLPWGRRRPPGLCVRKVPVHFQKCAPPFL